MPPYCSGEFIRGQANGAGSLWRVATPAAADLDSDGSAAPACGFIGSFTNGVPQGLGVGCRPAATLPTVAVSDLMHVCSYTAGGTQGEACAFSGMWGGGSPGGMGLMAGGSCVMMCSGFDADGAQVLPPPIPPLLLLLLLLTVVSCQGYTVMRTCNPCIDAGQSPVQNQQKSSFIFLFVSRRCCLQNSRTGLPAAR